MTMPRKKKCVNDMTRTEFSKLRHRKWNEDIGEFDSLIFFPTRRKHDSGYRCMEFIAVREGKPICKMSGCSDVVHLGGIAEALLYPKKMTWNIDCLPVSGLLQIFSHTHRFKVGADLSSFELLAGSKRQ
jgi:hypothetical protein